MEIDLAHLRSWIGKVEQSSERLTVAFAQRFNATFDRDTNISKNDPAPLMIHFCLAQRAEASRDLGDDGHPAKGGFLPPVPLPNRMWAGGDITFHAPILVGSTVTRRSVVADVTLKKGKSGQLCFVAVDHTILSGRSKAISERQVIVYRDVEEPGGVTPTQVPAATGQFRRGFFPTPTMLFRYSALTFNSHRIHYDAPYTIEKEGYSALVVQGPLQATFLAQFAADMRETPPRRFNFRGLSPLLNSSEFSINATDNGDKLTLWTAPNKGPIAMEASAQW